MVRPSFSAPPCAALGLVQPSLQELFVYVVAGLQPLHPPHEPEEQPLLRV